VKFSGWFALRLEIECAIHCGAVCEAVLASVACIKERPQTATKIFSEDRPPARRLSIVKIASSPLDHDRCIARAVEFPDQERRVIRRSFRTKSLTRVFTPVVTGESAIGTICDRLGPELNVTRRAF
jgi:hypothetical protein